MQLIIRHLSVPVENACTRLRRLGPSRPPLCGMTGAADLSQPSCDGSTSDGLRTLSGWQLLLEIDRKSSLRAYQELGSKLPRWSVMLLEHSGSGVLWLPLTPAIWSVKWLSPAARLCWANCFVLLWIDIALTGILKATFRRKRPIYNHVGDFLVVVAVDQYSFPSGHAARVSCLAMLAWICWRWQYAAAAAAWAVTVAISRAIMGRHYLGDVIAGLLLGFASAALLTQGTMSADGFIVKLSTSEWLHTQALQLLKY